MNKMNCQAEFFETLITYDMKELICTPNCESINSAPLPSEFVFHHVMLEEEAWICYVDTTETIWKFKHQDASVQFQSGFGWCTENLLIGKGFSFEKDFELIPKSLFEFSGFKRIKLMNFTTNMIELIKIVGNIENIILEDMVVADGSLADLFKYCPYLRGLCLNGPCLKMSCERPIRVPKHFVGMVFCMLHEEYGEYPEIFKFLIVCLKSFTFYMNIYKKDIIGKPEKMVLCSFQDGRCCTQ
uniref:Uncharacterized protein n=1 Tax=Panagrolaimus sp. ES5 TaxID=591445 RepID=A0AC34F8T4_9BILA